MENLHSKVTDKGVEIVEGTIERSDFYTIKEASELLGVTTKTIRNRIERKDIPAKFHLIGKGQSQYLIPKGAIDVPSTATDVVPFSRAVSAPALVSEIVKQLQEENQTLKNELKAIKETQNQILLLLERSEKKEKKSWLKRLFE